MIMICLNMKIKRLGLFSIKELRARWIEYHVCAPPFSLFPSICLSACLTFCLPFFWRSDTVVNENLKSFRSPSRDRWKRRRGWFPNGVSPVYKSTPEVCLVGLCAPRAVLAAPYFWVTREDIPPSGSFASLSLNASHAYDREMGNSGRLFGSRVVSRDARPPFLRRGEHLGNYATHRGIYFRIVSRTLKLRLRAVFHLFQASSIFFSHAGSKPHKQERDNKLFSILISCCCVYVQKDINNFSRDI